LATLRHPPLAIPEATEPLLMAANSHGVPSNVLLFRDGRPPVPRLLLFSDIFAENCFSCSAIRDDI
jgi:hypothetical protein